ncbi:MAG: hypothetical protein C7B45_12210 [Sulfobacillus acidophilus]|uniref:Uncharacterized protein n=1 Tax=Sulfobacillus acidophilus TaxID=53633 RepID=A0A2T2WFP5_9FIRM|nr:MAG: hypothetical protein C7B45_12210 [Sulfobacillus acidophilus]
MHEFHGRSYDHWVAHTTAVVLRSHLLAVAGRNETDDRTIASLFWALCNEMASLCFVEVWHLLMEVLRTALSDELRLSDAHIDCLLTVFLESTTRPKGRSLQVPARQQVLRLAG